MQMNWKDYKKVYFIGIGGVGMSALAQLLSHEGVSVLGSDRDDSPTTEMLRKRNIQVFTTQQASNVPEDADAIVYSDAVPADSSERTRADALGIVQYSYFQMLGKVSADKKTIAVSGTHGKTTTTGMLAYVLNKAGAKPTAVVGSIVRDFNSNYLAGDSDLFVVEACEYNNHLLELSPTVLIINNLEWDHTDYFKSLLELQNTFRKAISNILPGGVLITDTSNKNIIPLLNGITVPVIDYTKEEIPELLLPGEFNKMNARAASAAARFIIPNISNEVIVSALSTFHGTWRRFEYKGKTKKGADVYDDYAHHPTAIRATLEALRAKTKGKIIVAFHPHLYSRTRDLLGDFAMAFSSADEVVIAPIYAAREVDDGTISNSILAESIVKNGTKASAVNSFTEISSYLNKHTDINDVIMTMGAGDIYKVSDMLISKN